MIKRSYLFALVIALLYVGIATAQHPVLDAVANKVDQKYQQSSCEQLWQQKSHGEKSNLIVLKRHEPCDMGSAHFVQVFGGPVSPRAQDQLNLDEGKFRFHGQDHQEGMQFTGID